MQHPFSLAGIFITHFCLLILGFYQSNHSCSPSSYFLKYTSLRMVKKWTAFLCYYTFGIRVCFSKHWYQVGIQYKWSLLQTKQRLKLECWLTLQVQISGIGFYKIFWNDHFLWDKYTFHFYTNSFFRVLYLALSVLIIKNKAKSVCIFNTLLMNCWVKHLRHLYLHKHLHTLLVILVKKIDKLSLLYSLISFTCCWIWCLNTRTKVR